MFEDTAKSAILPPRHWPQIAALSCVGALMVGCGNTSGDSGPHNPDILRVKDGKIVDGRGNRSWLRGLILLNEIDWERGVISESLPKEGSHDEEAYREIAQLGMDTATFPVSYHWFDDDDAPFFSEEKAFDWIDRNVGWAQDHDIHLVLQLLDYPGSEWDIDCGRFRFFEETGRREEVVTLWATLAERYADEATIAGYDLLETPSPASLADWQSLAEELIAAIRAVDSQHLIVLERPQTIGCGNWEVPAAEAFPVVKDANVVYQRSFNWKWEFTQQHADPRLTEDQFYPDDSDLSVDWAQMRWLGDSRDSTPSAPYLRVPPGSSDWEEKHYTYTVTDPAYELGELYFQSNRNPESTVYFDDVTVDEYDEDFEHVRRLFDVDFNDFEDPDQMPAGFLWQDDENGHGWADTAPGRDASDPGDRSLTISNTVGLANFGNGYLFHVTQGHTYEVKGWMKGEQVAEHSQAMIMLQFWDYDGDPVGFNRSTVRQHLSDAFDFAAHQGRPLLTEFVIGQPACEEERGGLAWTRDVLDMIFERDGGFVYPYHHEFYGLYGGTDGLPGPEDVNQPLRDLFIEELDEAER